MIRTITAMALAATLATPALAQERPTQLPAEIAACPLIAAIAAVAAPITMSGSLAVGVGLCWIAAEEWKFHANGGTHE